MSPDLETLQLEGYTLTLLLKKANTYWKKTRFLCKLQIPPLFILVKEIAGLVLDFTVIILADEEGEMGIDLSLPYFLRARSKIACIQVQNHHFLCFVRKDQNFSRFNRRTFVFGRKQMEEIRALAVKDCLAKREKQEY